MRELAGPPFKRALQAGLIGGGYWGERLLAAFRTTPGIEITCLADDDPKRLAACGGGLRTATDHRVLLDADLDVAVIATPPSTHYPIARDALRAGKHCWVEKPLAMDVAQASELVSLAESRGRILFVDETFLYDPLLRTARRWIREGRLGELRHLSFERLGMGRVRRDSDVWWNSASHDLSILRYLVPARVEQIRIERFAYLQPGIADVCTGTVRLEHGISAHIYLSWLSPVRCARVVVVGSKAMLRYEGRFDQRRLILYGYEIPDPTLVASNVVPVSGFETLEEIAGGSEQPLALAVRAFVEAIVSGAPAPSEGIHSLAVVELLAAAEQS
jgi:UDP-2-acetamido-3-amino-2,3-dideoxy-glucuronate N-acetyltransferase